jgi:heme-degrading monooxygenase HmoA
MAIGVYWAHPDMSQEEYEDSMVRLEERGQGAPEGRLYHFAFKDEKGMHIWSVWESQEAFERFRESLIPAANDSGIEYVQPNISEIVKIVAA